MGMLEAIGLGVLQGLTEFLPVSSSGHLALAEHYLGVDSPGVTFEVFVHFGTALAVLVFFRSRINPSASAAARRTLWSRSLTSATQSSECCTACHSPRRETA